jgi:hypothetical protein
MKYGIVVLSDPKNGTEESAGRAFNALSAAYDFIAQPPPLNPRRLTVLSF